MTLGTLTLRLVVGGTFVGHGLQKLRGSFGGPGLEGADQMMKSLSMEPARRNSLAASLSETVGGAGIALGAGTPFAAAAIIATMVTAVRKVHLKNGFFNAGGGYEYHVVLVAVLALLAEGPGKASIDALIGKSKWGVGWGLFALGAGAAGSTIAIELGRRGAAAAALDAGTAEAADAAI